MISCSVAWQPMHVYVCAGACTWKHTEKEMAEVSCYLCATSLGLFLRLQLKLFGQWSSSRTWLRRASLSEREWSGAAQLGEGRPHKSATVNELWMGMNPKQKDEAETNVHWHLLHREEKAGIFATAVSWGHWITAVAGTLGKDHLHLPAAL